MRTTTTTPPPWSAPASPWRRRRPWRCSPSLPAPAGAPAAAVTAGPTSAGAPTLTIGISFDQPGLGLKSGNTYSGFDVLTAVYIAKSMGVPGVQHHLGGGRPGRPREAAGRRQGRPRPVDLLDHPRARQPGRLRRPLLRRPPGPARPAQRHGDRPRHPRRAQPLLGAQHDLGQARHREVRGQDHPHALPDLLAVRAGPGRRQRRRRDDRRRHPRRVCRPAGVQGPAQGRRQGLLRRALRRRHQEGQLGDGRQGQRRAQGLHRRRLVEVQPRGHGGRVRLRHPQPADPGS